MPDFYQQAAVRYRATAELYRQALAAVASTGPACDFARSALEAHVRLKFRGISSRLTNDIGVTLASRASLQGQQDLDVDHAVPLAGLHDRILVLDSVGEIAALLRPHMLGVRITVTEHRALNRQYKMSMPEGWQWGDDPLARYRAVGIELVSINC
jgi:hypothetical protein